VVEHVRREHFVKLVDLSVREKLAEGGLGLEIDFFGHDAGFGAACAIGLSRVKFLAIVAA
jgi:hypothetical protein